MAFEEMAAPFRRAAEEYGGILLVEEGVVTVLATQTELAGGDPERVLLMLINLSLNVVFATPFGTPSTTRGVRLAPNGGFISINARDDGILQTARWVGVTDVGTAAVYRLSQRRTIAL